MHKALCEDKGMEGNYLLPFYYYYATTSNTVYCLLNTIGATFGSPSQCHSLEPSLASENLFCLYGYIYIHIYT